MECYIKWKGYTDDHIYWEPHIVSTELDAPKDYWAYSNHTPKMLNPRKPSGPRFFISLIILLQILVFNVCLGMFPEVGFVQAGGL